tara:strand:- start:809 stop:1138 length:330 start_codon:yes stop_codon:yes gene_type:complete
MLGDDSQLSKDSSGRSFAESDITFTEPSQRLYAPRLPSLAAVVEAKVHPPDNVNVLVCIDEAWRAVDELRGTNILAVIQHEEEEVQVLQVVSLCALKRERKQRGRLIPD